jgi:hypothetical protein
MKMIDYLLLEDNVKTSQCKKVMYNNLSCCQVRATCGIIRVLDESHLEAARKVFDDSFGVRTNLPVPSMKMLKQRPTIKATAWLCNMDQVRIVSCIGEECDFDPGKAKPSLIPSDNIDIGDCSREKRMKLLCSYRGLDIRQSISCNGIPKLSVQCRFSS